MLFNLRTPVVKTIIMPNIQKYNVTFHFLDIETSVNNKCGEGRPRSATVEIYPGSAGITISPGDSGAYTRQYNDIIGAVTNNNMSVMLDCYDHETGGGTTTISSASGARNIMDCFWSSPNNFIKTFRNIQLPRGNSQILIKTNNKMYTYRTTHFENYDYKIYNVNYNINASKNIHIYIPYNYTAESEYSTGAYFTAFLPKVYEDINYLKNKCNYTNIIIQTD